MKKIIITVIVLIFLGLLCSLLNFTMVVPISTYNNESKNPQIGDTIYLLKDLDLSKGNWKAYIILSRNDFKELNPVIKKAKCLKTTDIKLLQKMKNDWIFTYKAVDIATVESAIYIYSNNKLVFESGIVLDKNQQGLQNRTYGWIEPIKPNVLIDCCKEFKKSYWPIIFL